ncbi:MAG: bicyclomycin resistance protein [Gammaproteobacteria bacterium]|nr:bicyclomycin resistance protein [Gammaproteobacteria bacterium]
MPSTRLRVRAAALLACMVAAVAGVAAAAGPAQGLKVVRFAFRAVETGFDPQRVDDLYSSAVNGEIFESLLQFDYLARPVRLMPQVAERVPEPEEGGLVYTFHLKQGVYFADDPAFRGRRRELVAGDAVYALKRLRDPRNRAPYAWLVENRIVGLDEAHDAAVQSGAFDYDAPVAGLQVLDRYTLRIRLKRPDFNFLYIFTMPQTAPVAREVIEAYAADTMAHPVGTGPFRLVQWVRRSKIVLERNPVYRGDVLETAYADPKDPIDQRVIRELTGKRLPQLDRVELYPIEEEQPRFLAFMNGEHDLLQETPAAYINQVLPGGHLAPTLARAGVGFQREVAPSITYDLFQMENPVVGGYTPSQVALRRAMVLGHDRGAEIAIVRRGVDVPAQSPVPPGVVGYDAGFNSGAEQDFDPARAQALLDLYGFVDRDGDGFRERPDGSLLVIDYMHSTGGQTARALAELWEKSMRRIGIRLVPRAVQFSDQIRDRKAGKFMLASAAWAADYPDAQNFLQLLYGPYSGDSNDSRFRLPAYDRLYEQALAMPDSPERNALYREMCRLMLAYAPWRLGIDRVFVNLYRPWVLGYKKHPMYHISLRFLDVDLALQQAAAGP